MVDDSAIKAARERKRKAQAAYTGYDDEEFDEDRIGRKADVLSKYDDEFSTGNAKSEGFRLGAAPLEQKISIVDEDTEMIGVAPAVKVKLNLDYASELRSQLVRNVVKRMTEAFDVSDYMREGEGGFKKPKVSLGNY